MKNSDTITDIENTKSGPLERTLLWKLRNVPPIIFRLALFALAIYFSKDVWLIDITDLKIAYRSSYLLMRIISFLCAIWIVDCLVRIHGFTNPKTLLIYEIIKAIAILFCILFLTTIFIYMGYNESLLWYIPSFVGGFVLIQITKLMQLSHVIENYQVTSVLDITKIDTSQAQDAADAAGGFIYCYISHIQHQITVDGVIYNNNPLLNSIVRYKFADYKNGKPLRVIYSTKNPKFNIIFQD